MSDIVDTGDHGYQGDDDDGRDFGHLHSDLEQSHQEIGQDYSHDQHYAAVAESDHHEHDVKYVHEKHVSITDKYGNEYKEDDVTYYADHDESDHSNAAQQYDEHEDYRSYAEQDYLEKVFDELFANEYGHGNVHEIGEADPHPLVRK
jgi:hypothetical protein